MALKHRLSSEAGFGLVEVMVTAMIVLILAAGVLTGFNAASNATGRVKAKSVAITLAQKDQERLRAMPISDLANIDEINNIPMCDANGAKCVSYSVASKAQWVSDSKGLESCTTPNAGLDYLKISSTVTWPSLGSGTPVVTQSMVAPAIGALGAGQGSLAVQVVRADGITGVSGLPVNLSGTATDSGVTNSLGCVVWGLLPIGNYTATVDQAGFVGVQGTQHVDKPAGVVENSLSTTTILYDGAASATISFFSKIGSTTYTEKQSQVTLKQSQMSPVTRVFATANGLPGSTITATSLFPFKTGSPGGPYNVYAGGCQGAEPTTPIAFADLSSGANATYALQIPAFDFKVQVNGIVSNAATTMTRVTQVTANCVNPAPPAAQSVDSTGHIADPGFPYGTYNICAQALVGATTRKVTLSNVNLNALTVTPNAGVINVITTSSAGTC